MPNPPPALTGGFSEDGDRRISRQGAGKIRVCVRPQPHVERGNIHPSVSCGRNKHTMHIAGDRVRNPPPAGRVVDDGSICHADNANRVVRAQESDIVSCRTGGVSDEETCAGSHPAEFSELNKILVHIAGPWLRNPPPVAGFADNLHLLVREQSIIADSRKILAGAAPHVELTGRYPAGSIYAILPPSGP